MRPVRIPEIHYYEWSVSRWATSSTRDRLDATGRGIFRELLDLCYTQGGFPFEVDLLCRKCACSSQQFDLIWPIIEKHFPKDKHDPAKRINHVANMIRRAYFNHCEEQSKRRKHTRSKTGITTPTESTDKDMVDNPDSNPVRTDPTKMKLKMKLKEEMKRNEDEVGAPDASSTPPPSDTSDSPSESGVSEGNGFVSIEDAFERMYARHPKKGHRAGAERAYAHVAGIDCDQTRARIDAVHAQWCATEAWTWKSGASAPFLDEWLTDHGYRYKPKAVVNPNDPPPLPRFRPDWEAPQQ